MNMAERIAKVETEVSNLKDKTEQAEKRNTNEHNELKVMIKDFIDSAPSKFASKNVEKVLYTIIGVIITGFLGKVMEII